MALADAPDFGKVDRPDRMTSRSARTLAPGTDGDLLASRAAAA